MQEPKKDVYLHEYRDVRCPVCGKLFFRNEDAKGNVVCKCKYCKQTVKIKL